MGMGEMDGVDTASRLQGGSCKMDIDPPVALQDPPYYF